MKILIFGISVVFFFLILISSVLLPSEAQIATEENLFKFDSGFYEKIRQIQSTNDTNIRSDSLEHQITTRLVIIVTDDGYEQQLQDKLQQINATNIFIDYTLDYIIADIPIDNIIPLAIETSVVKIGDGDEQLILQHTMDQIRVVIDANNIGTATYPYTGNNITVGVIDSGVDFNHIALHGKSAGKVLCATTVCVPITNVDDHGTAIAGVIAADTAIDSLDGIAPDVLIYNVIPLQNAAEDTTRAGYYARSLTHLLEQNVTIAVSATARQVVCNDYTALSIIIDRAVKEGLAFNTSVGNKGINGSGSVVSFSCGFNSISVGSVDIRRDISSFSSQGPAIFTIPTGDSGRIKPEITAVGEHVEILEVSTTNDPSPYTHGSGTSFAAPQVAGASALILEKQKNYTPLEIKAALLIGADWNAPVPATAADYDNDVRDIRDEMNEYGFGILNVERSLDYANSDGFPNIIYEINPAIENFANKQYMITVQQDEQVKVLLSWLIHPRGSVTDPTLPINHPSIPFSSQFHNYDVTVSRSDGTVIGTSDSDIQNNEFVVFDATPGNYVITVSSDGTLRTDTYEPFVIASTHPLDAYPFETPITPTSITFASTLSDDRSRITLQFSERLSKEFVPSDFTISDGTITSIQNFPNSAYRYLQVSSVPYNTDVTVRYTGTTYNLGTGTLELTTGTESVATGISIPPPPRPIAISFTDSFQSTLSSWTLSGNNDWETGTPRDSTGQPSGNKVLTSDDCDSQCIISLNSNLDTASPLDITFDRFISRSIDSAEGLYVQYSTDDTRWTTLASYTENNRQDTGRWADTSLTLDITQSTASLRFVAESSYPGEFVEIDNVSIYPKVADTTSPTITKPIDKTFEATGEMTLLTADDIGTATATDLVDPNPIVTSNIPPSFEFGIGTTTITWTATDSSGNSNTATQIITVQDTTPPTITKPANKTFEATGEQTPLTTAQIGTATANDRVDPNPTIRSDAVSTFRVGTTAITWTATDSYGNSDTATQIITIRDTTPPTITKPANKTFEATGEMTLLTADDIGTATANDRVDPNPIVTSNIPQSFEFGVTTTIITWTATDSYGNSDTATQIITIRDTTPPIIQVPADVSFTTTDTSIVLTSADYGTATARDRVDSSPTITNNATSSFQADRTTTITWTATDDYGNSAHAPQLVTVVHSSLRIFVPADITVEASEMHNTVNIGTANATHDTDTNITITNNAPLLFDVGVTVVTWTATDSIGVTVTAIQTVTVQDTTDPILYYVSDLDFVFEIDTPIIINYDYPTATDLADDSVDVTCTPASGTIFNENTTVVTCTATDDSGNTADITFNVDVVVFDPNIFSDNFEDGNMDGWTVTDYFDTWAAVPLEANVYPPGHASTNKVAEVVFCDITCSMTTSGIDLSGHDDPIFLQFYRYADSSLDNDSYFQVETYNGSSWVVFDKWVPDNFHHDGAWHLEQYSLSDYTHVRDFGMRFTAYMESSSESVGIDDVRVFFVPEQVSDGTVPVIVPPVSIVAEAAGALTTVDIGNAIATPATNTTISNDAPTSFPLGSTTVTWTATDSSDNSDTATQRITIQDTTPPDITAPADVSFTITGTSIALTASDYGASTATDLIDSSPTITDNAPDLFPLGNTTITWTATDDYGNSAQATQQVTVILSSLMITAPADITAEATGTLTTVDIGNAIATHDTDTNITITNDAPLSFRVGTTTVITWTATDSVNDVVTDTQRITVQDTTNPVFSSVTDLDFIFEPGVPLAINYDSPTATDSVNGSVDVTCAPASGTVFSGGTTGVTCTAADNSGNTADITFNVDVLVLSTTIFLDDFEDRRLNGWTVTDYSDTWDSYPQESGVNPPDHPSTNKVAQVSWCDITCTMSITGFDLSGNAYPEFLQFYRYVDDTLDNGEYLLLEVYDGSSWTELDRWTPEDSDDDDAWHLEEYSLADYTEVTDFGMRFTTVMSSLDEAVAIDDVKIFIVP